MAVVDDELICRLCVEVKEFCVDSLARVELQQLIEKKIRLCLLIIVSIIQHLFAFMLPGVGFKIIKNPEVG